MPFTDPERRRAYQRSWIARNAGRHREQSRAGVRRWRVRHSEEHRAYRRRHYALNAERLRAEIAAWHRAHPDVHRLARVRRRAREADAPGDFGLREWNDLVERYRSHCAYCGLARPLQADHRVPLARGGTNDIENIVPSCARCNQQKGARTEEEFRARLTRERRRDQA